jgi:hypothetical protein
MGMDLIPNNRGIASISYNLSAWRTLRTFLDEHDALTDEFSTFNDGDLIKEETCKRVADVMEDHFGILAWEFSRDDKDEEVPEQVVLYLRHLRDTCDVEELLREHIKFWRDCGGCRQF